MSKRPRNPDKLDVAKQDDDALQTALLVISSNDTFTRKEEKTNRDILLDWVHYWMVHSERLVPPEGKHDVADIVFFALGLFLDFFSFL